MSNPCYATQHSDQMICHKCGLVWDMNDPDPRSAVARNSRAFARPQNNYQLNNQPRINLQLN